MKCSSSAHAITLYAFGIAKSHCVLFAALQLLLLIYRRSAQCMSINCIFCEHNALDRHTLAELYIKIGTDTLVDSYRIYLFFYSSIAHHLYKKSLRRFLPCTFMCNSHQDDSHTIIHCMPKANLTINLPFGKISFPPVSSVFATSTSLLINPATSILPFSVVQFL